MALGFSHDVDPGALDAYNAKLKAAALADPALGNELKKQAQKQPFDSNLVIAKLKALGLDTPPKGAWISGGEGAKEPTDPFWTKALPIMGAALAGGYALSAAAGAGAPAAGITTGPTLEQAGLTTAAKTGFSAKSLFSGITGGDLLKTGVGITGNVLSANAQKHASDLEAQAADKALAFQKEQYEQQRTDNAPYRQVGASSLAALSQGLGLPAYQAPPSAPTNGGTLASLAQPPQAAQTPDAMVSLRAPNGSVKQVPASQADHFVQLGAQRVA